MKFRWLLLRGWVSYAAGAVVCWWRRGHVESWEAGVLPSGFTLNNDPDSSSNRYWERTYCIRCGATLREETP